MPPPCRSMFTTYVESLDPVVGHRDLPIRTSTPTTLTLNLRQSTAGFPMTKDITLPPYGHDAKFFTDPGGSASEEFEAR